MSPRLILAVPLLLSMSGCVALPLVSQAMTGTNAASQACSFAKEHGQLGSICDHLSMDALKQKAREVASNISGNTSTVR